MAANSHHIPKQSSQLSIDDRTENMQLSDKTKNSTEDAAISTHVVTKEQKTIARRRVLTFIGLQLALFLSSLDGTIVSTAMPTIGSEFNQTSIVSWVATAYILTFDAFRIRHHFRNGAFGTTWKVSGYCQSVFAFSSICGPLIGGSLTDHVTWRWDFYINLPIGAVAMAIVFFFCHSPSPTGTVKEKLKRVDYLGTILVLSFATLFLLALNFGGQQFPWKSPAVIVPLIMAFLLIAALCVVESRYAKEPVMPPRIFKNWSINAIMITNFCFGCAFFSVGYYLPVYFQIVRGDSATESGIRLIPMQLIVPFGSTGVGWIISRYGQWKPFLQFGMVVLCISIGLMVLLDDICTWSLIYGITCVCGVGVGCLYGSALIGLQASAEAVDVAVITGLCNFARILGGALGVAISSTILNSSLAASLPNYMPLQYAERIIDSSLYIRNGLPLQYKDTAILCYVAGLKLLWNVITGIAGVGVISCIFIKHKSLCKDKDNAENIETVLTDKEPSSKSTNPGDIAVDVPVLTTCEKLSSRGSAIATDEV